MLWNVKEGTIRFENCSMDYMVFGKGYRPLVLIRGLNITRLKGTSLSLLERYRLYAENFRVYMVDRRDPVPEEITVNEIAEDVYSALQALGIHRAFVMGNSQGGMIAQYLALNHPKMVEKLVLNVTACEPNEVLTKNVEHWVDMAHRNELGKVSDEFMDLMYPPDKRPKPNKILPLLMKNLKIHTPEEFAVLAQSCLSVDTKDRLKEIKCPVLVLGGAKDVIMSGEASVTLAEALGTEAVIFDDLGHGAYETKEYQKKVIEFLKEE